MAESRYPLSEPDTTFRLGAETRERMLPWYDADALERLLQMVPPGGRAEILENFLKPQAGEQRGLLVQLGHPALDALLEEVWAPFWDGCSEEEMNEQPEYLPGREAARLRRANGS